MLYYTRCASDYLINRVIIDWVNSTLNLGWIYRQFCSTTLILNFLKIIILIGRWLHPGVISLNNVFEALICQINPDGGWKLNVCEDLLRMKSTLRLNISIYNRETLNKRLLVTNMGVEIIDSHFRKHSFHFTGTFWSDWFHLSLWYINIYDWTENVIIIVDENDLESFRFYRLPVANYVFKSIIKLYLFNLDSTTHFFLLSEHSIYLNICIFVRELIRTEKLFIIYICLFWILSTKENSISLDLFFLSYRFSWIIIQDSSHNCSTSLVCCISSAKEYSKVIWVILKSTYVGFSLIICFDERYIIVLIFII